MIITLGGTRGEGPHDLGTWGALGSPCRVLLYGSTPLVGLSSGSMSSGKKPLHARNRKGHRRCVSWSVDYSEQGSRESPCTGPRSVWERYCRGLKSYQYYGCMFLV